MNRLFLVLGASVLSGALIALIAVAGTQTAPIPPAHHIEWHTYPVGGYLLINPAVPPDSLGRQSALVLPPGSQLEVPYEVTGPSESEKLHDSSDK